MMRNDLKAAITQRLIDDYAFQATVLTYLVMRANVARVAVICGNAGLTARVPRRKEAAPSLDSSGFFLRNAWQVLLWASYVGGVMPCRFLGSGLSTRIVPPTLFDSGEAGLTKPRSLT